FCRLWIPDFSSLAKPLHESTRGAEKDPFVWGPEQQQAFLVIKQRLMEAPALGLPNSEKPFQLYVHEQNGIAAAVLTQRLGSWNRPVAYLSKQLDSVAKGWPPCLRAVAATASLVKEADKFTFGQTMY
ncbi:RT_RNaseH_2 domain-containing protein, partial [Podarcis lilfordi]